jgi:D-lactate dehydrogenase (cytochrome)
MWKERMDSKIVDELRRIVGAENVLTEPEDFLVYEYDASFHTHAPDAVVLPANTEEVSRIMTLAAREHVPVVARGGGTGLSGGAVCLQGGILLVLVRMNAIKGIDYRNRRAQVEAGVINLDLVTATAKAGYTYAPDPGSGKCATIGGNVNSNAGGMHCLAYGVTANHILGLRVVLPDGTTVNLGGRLADSIGYDLTGVMVGSEGTFGIVTEATTQLMRTAESVATLLVVFKTNVEDASAAVSDVIAHGIIPTAMEMMDGMVTRAVEQSVHAGYPEDAAGVLLIECEGLADGLDQTMAKIEEICRQHHAADVRRATNDAERALLWTGRKSALGSMGRIAPNYYLEDGVVPRRKLPEMMAMVERTAEKYQLPIGNFFHAGDGNIHPTILFDRHDPDANQRALKAADEILRACIQVGGTVSGEHGVGTEKQEFMELLYNQDDLDAMADLRACFNPDGLLNPGKIFPTSFRPSGNGGSSVPRAGRPTDDRIVEELTGVVGGDHIQTGGAAAAYAVGDRKPAVVVRPGSVDEVAAIMRKASELNLSVSPWGGGTKRALGDPLPRLDLVVSLERMNQVLEHYPSDLTAAVQAGCTLRSANDAFGRSGQMVPLDSPLPGQATLGGIVAGGPFSTGLRRFAYGTIRDMLLGIQVVRADGRIFRRGGLVVKNVAGYDLARLQYGAMGTLGIMTQLNLRLLPIPEVSRVILAGTQRWDQARPIVENLVSSQLQPATLAGFDAGLASELGLDDSFTWLLVRFDGRSSNVERQIRDTESWMRQAGVDAVEHWDSARVEQASAVLPGFCRMGGAEPGRAVLRLNVTPSDTFDALTQLQGVIQDEGWSASSLADAGVGTLWIRVEGPDSSPERALASLLARLRREWPQTVLAAAADAAKESFSVWGAAPEGLHLMERIRHRFDPAGLLNPQRYLVREAGAAT